jgi:hypothetical protein
VKDGLIYGRGASDMKGGVAAMTMAVQIIRDLGVTLKGDLIVQFVVDEELTGYGTLAAIQRGYYADAGICLETSDLCVQPACVGRLWFTLELIGKAVSATRHWEGVSAIDKGMLFVQAFKELEQRRWRTLTHPLYPDNRVAMPCGVFMFNSGSFPSAVPDLAVLRGSLGLLPSEDVENVKRTAPSLPASETGGVYDARNGVTFPEGFEILRNYKRKDYRAHARNGFWVRADNGSRYLSLNQLNSSLLRAPRMSGTATGSTALPTARCAPSASCARDRCCASR